MAAVWVGMQNRQKKVKQKHKGKCVTMNMLSSLVACR